MRSLSHLNLGLKATAILVNAEPEGVYVTLNPVNPALLWSSRYRRAA